MAVVDGEPRYRSGALAAPLLAYLSAAFGAQDLDYSSPLEQLSGGFDTSTFRFRVSDAPETVSQPLVLRLYRPSQGGDRARFEGTAQNALVDAGIAAPRVHLVCDDTDVLGGAFIVMDHLPGRRLIDAPDNVSSALLGRAQADLHDLPTEPVERALADAGFDRTGLRHLLSWFDPYADTCPQIRRSLDWLDANRPPEPRPLAICHGDFHKLNVLVDGTRLTGIVDWSALTIADPVFDIATTTMLFTIPARYLVADATFSPTDLDQVVADYLAAYRGCRPVAADRLDYYLALRCLRALTLGLAGQKLWRHAGIVSDLARTVERVTGCSPMP